MEKVISIILTTLLFIIALAEMWLGWKGLKKDEFSAVPLMFCSILLIIFCIGSYYYTLR